MDERGEVGAPRCRQRTLGEEMASHLQLDPNERVAGSEDGCIAASGLQQPMEAS